MTRFRLGAALCAALALAACGSVPSHLPAPGVEVPAAPALSTAAQTALWSAEAAYNVPAQAYTTLDADGALPASIKARVKPVLVQLDRAMEVIRSAAAAGDSAGVLRDAPAAEKLAATAKSLLPTQ
jgi:hypothetical protein